MIISVMRSAAKGEGENGQNEESKSPNVIILKVSKSSKQEKHCHFLVKVVLILPQI